MLIPIILIVCGVILIRLRESFFFDGLAIIAGLFLAIIGMISLSKKIHAIWENGWLCVLLITVFAVFFSFKIKGKQP